MAAEEIGIDGAYFRVTTSRASSPRRSRCSPRSAARTQRIEIGTAVIDMRYENPLYMAEEAAAADLISGGRLQLGISRGSPEPALRGSEAFGHVPGGRARPTPTWRAPTPRSSARRSPASRSSTPTRR